MRDSRPWCEGEDQVQRQHFRELHVFMDTIPGFELGKGIDSHFYACPKFHSIVYLRCLSAPWMIWNESEWTLPSWSVQFDYAPVQRFAIEGTTKSELEWLLKQLKFLPS